MNLTQCLLYRDIAELRELASIYKCSCNRNSKLELVQTLHHHIMNQANCRNLLAESEQDLLYFVTYIFFQPVRQFRVNELMAKGSLLAKIINKEIMPRQLVRDLLKRGWLFPSPAKYHVQLEIPLDLHKVMKKALVHYWLTHFKIEINDAGFDSGYRDEGDLIVRDLLVFLKEIEQHSLPLTMEGYLHKRKQQMIIQKFHIEESLIREKSYRFGYGRRFPAYPNRFALIYDFCFAQGWLMEEDGYLSLSEPGKQFLEKQALNQLKRLHQQIITFWIHTYSKPIACLPFIYCFIKACLEAVTIQREDLFKLVSIWLNTYYFDDLESVFQQRIIRMMLHLGIIQISLDQKYIRLKNSL